MKIISFYTYFVEKIRGGHNLFVYSFLFFFSDIFRLKDFQVFKDSNGWFLTFRYKNHIYKIRWFLTFLRYGFSYKKLKSNINSLKKLSGNRFTPNIVINDFCIKQDYILESRSFDYHMATLGNSRVKIEFFLKVVSLIDSLHGFGFCHGDLKTKNVLVDKFGNPFFIDLEFLSKTKDYEKRKDFVKFFDGALFWLSESELSHVTFESALKHKIKEILLQKYFNKLNVIHTLKKYEFIAFEHDTYDKGQDIDVLVNSYKDFNKIIDILNKNKLNFNVHFCFCDDIKVYIKDGNEVVVLDVHLRRKISPYFLYIKKLFSNEIIKIFITGPDGVGKSTIINELVKGECKNTLELFNVKKMHANRFHRETLSCFLDEKIIDYLSRISIIGFFLKSLSSILIKLSEKSKIFLFDRSFLDYIVQKEKNSKLNSFIIGLFSKKHFIILLYDEFENINQRKSELDREKIAEYFYYFKGFSGVDFVVEVGDISETNYKVKSIIKYKIMKDSF